MLTESILEESVDFAMKSILKEGTQDIGDIENIENIEDFKEFEKFGKKNSWDETLERQELKNAVMRVIEELKILDEEDDLEKVLNLLEYFQDNVGFYNACKNDHSKEFGTAHAALVSKDANSFGITEATRLLLRVCDIDTSEKIGTYKDAKHMLLTAQINESEIYIDSALGEIGLSEEEMTAKDIQTPDRGMYIEGAIIEDYKIEEDEDNINL